MPFIHCYVALIIMKKNDIKTILESQKIKAKIWCVDIDKVTYRGEVQNKKVS